MSDLATALQQVLRQVRKETEHTRAGAPNRRASMECDEYDCFCDWQERVGAEQARRWAMSLEAVIGIRFPVGDQWGAAIAAAQTPSGTTQREKP